MITIEIEYRLLAAMLARFQFSLLEIAADTGLSEAEVARALPVLDAYIEPHDDGTLVNAMSRAFRIKLTLINVIISRMETLGRNSEQLRQHFQDHFAGQKGGYSVETAERELQRLEARAVDSRSSAAIVRRVRQNIRRAISSQQEVELLTGTSVSDVHVRLADIAQRFSRVEAELIRGRVAQDRTSARAPGVGQFSKASDKDLPFHTAGYVYWDLQVDELRSMSLSRGELELSATGSLVAQTGEHTGRSVKDKFTVRDATTEDSVWWDNNYSMSNEHFALLLQDIKNHISERELFVSAYSVPDPSGQRQILRFVTNCAWHAIAVDHFYGSARKIDSRIAAAPHDLLVIDFPSFRADPRRHACRSGTVVAINLSERIIIIGGTTYVGEIKKAVFSALGYFAILAEALPMNASASLGPGGDLALFFGLSGTGKTSLAHDHRRECVGDDSLFWTSAGIGGWESGSYPKAIGLDAERTPELWSAVVRPNVILENVVLSGTDRLPDFDDQAITENTRAIVPASAERMSRAAVIQHPDHIFLLCSDAFGVMPPIARLSIEQALYFYLSGYTSKIAGTEKGMSSAVESTFSANFGHPYLMQHPAVYAAMFRARLEQTNASCWMLNTGWTGGKYGVGARMPIKATRALLHAACSGQLKNMPMRVDPYFGFQVPTSVPGIDPKLLNPRETWGDASGFDAMSRRLVEDFHKNFESFSPHVDHEVRNAAPQLRKAASNEH